MYDLIKALQIFAKYTKEDAVVCEHDVIHIYVSPFIVMEQDRAELEVLSFHQDFDNECFYSYRFGSC